ncbi:MAG: serine hydrolase [Bacilli bacterium]|nr:serine hydrolase [Bacilli bacterium]
MIKDLEKLIEEAIADGAFPGANYYLVADKEYYGSLGLKSHIEYTTNNLDTIYDLASVSKVVSTVTCIMLLLEQGKLRLYDSVSSYLPRFRFRNITVWDLVTHTSGLKADVIAASKIRSKDELLNQIYQADLVYETNSKLIYSDIGFMLLGFIIEKVSGMSLAEFAKKNIFEPLDMVDTAYNPADLDRCAPTEMRDDELYKGYLRGKVHDEKAYILDGIAGHAGVFSTVRDLSNFIKMILNDGIYNGKRFLSKASIDKLFTPQVEEKNGLSLNNEKRSIGWIIGGSYPSCGDLASCETIHHTGYTGTNIFIDRKNKIGFTMLANRVHPTRDNIKIIPFRAKLGNYIISHFEGYKK